MERHVRAVGGVSVWLKASAEHSVPRTRCSTKRSGVMLRRSGVPVIQKFSKPGSRSAAHHFASLMLRSARDTRSEMTRFSLDRFKLSPQAFASVLVVLG